jgi:hypothetical protein
MSSHLLSKQGGKVAEFRIFQPTSKIKFDYRLTYRVIECIVLITL